MGDDLLLERLGIARPWPERPVSEANQSGKPRGRANGNELQDGCETLSEAVAQA